MQRRFGTIWRNLDGQALTFSKRLENTTALLSQTAHIEFHQGLEHLGRLLGAKPTRVSEPGAPDVVWTFGGVIHVAHEAKSEKTSSELSKADVQQARGHIDWVRHRASIASKDDTVYPVIVSPTANLDGTAKPHVGGVYCLLLGEVRLLAEDAATELSKLRLKFAGEDFATVRVEFEADLTAAGLDFDALLERLLARPLTSMV